MALAAAAALLLALAAAPGRETPAGTTAFKCQDGSDVTARFAARGERFVAIVDAGDGPHVLTSLPGLDSGPVKLTWSDGVRTLTWSPGVQIMFLDRAGHRMCGRAHGHGGHGR
ncbi:MAG: hypothetical protein JNK30_07930 [Phenylobacterium sp.]|uniref:hypothetical protein n=1 Tax=Phenylobacterium sp. TaxID=1871053 RepID=UPI001A4C5875|nr:hypothetical protein [Phenylobacterium sp.]MBL8771298.1 hypothetical protein [Phenylobacterium sp.]